MGAADAEGAGAALVTMVVALGAADGAGAGAFPVPSQTVGPGMGYVVAFMASGESILKAMPGSVPVYAPGKDTSADAGGDAVPDPVTVN
jgi:hypothetical protein